MRLSLIIVATTLALCKTEADTYLRNLRRHESGGGRGKLSAEELQVKIDTECPNFNCTGETNETLKQCNSSMDEPEAPDTKGFDGDTKSKLRPDFRAKKERCRQNMMKCACCAGMSAEDIMTAREEHGESRSFGGGGGGGGHRPEGQPSANRLQSMIDTKCPNFDCNASILESVTCTLASVEVVTSSREKFWVKRKRHRKNNGRHSLDNNVLKCACCDGMSAEGILDAREEQAGSGIFESSVGSSSGDNSSGDAGTAGDDTSDGGDP